MTTAILARDALMPRRPAGMGAGLVLALIAHALLVAALAFSVRWKTSSPAGVEAELWAAVPQIAAPRAAAPEPLPVPVPVEVKPAPPPPPPPVAKPEPAPVPDAQIAIEKAKRDEAKRLEDEKKREEAEKRAEKEKREAINRDQAKSKEDLERKKKDDADRKKKDEADNVKQVAAAREANLKRILGQAGATGDAGSTGTAARTAGPSAGYAGRIRARIQPNIVFGDSVTGNPLATVEVRLAPDGTIVGKRLIKSSGVKAWDDAVLRAIDKTEQIPRDTDGRVPPVIEIDFKPYD